MCWRSLGDSSTSSASYNSPSPPLAGVPEPLRSKRFWQARGWQLRVVVLVLQPLRLCLEVYILHVPAEYDSACQPSSVCQLCSSAPQGSSFSLRQR
jgi:hypothetical protein